MKTMLWSAAGHAGQAYPIYAPRDCCRFVVSFRSRPLPLGHLLVELLDGLPKPPLGVLVYELELVLSVDKELLQLPVVDLILYRLLLLPTHTISGH